MMEIMAIVTHLCQNNIEKVVLFGRFLEYMLAELSDLQLALTFRLS